MAKPAVPDFSGIPGWHQFETNDYGRMKMVHVLVCVARKLLLVTVVYVFWKESNVEFPGKAGRKLLHMLQEVGTFVTSKLSLLSGFAPSRANQTILGKLSLSHSVLSLVLG